MYNKNIFYYIYMHIRMYIITISDTLDRYDGCRPSSELCLCFRFL